MKFCLAPGCPNRVESSYCAQHQSVQAGRRGSASERGYTWRWQKAAKAFLREFPLCGMRPAGRSPVGSACQAEQRVTAANVVDHVEPHRGDARLFWDAEGNWQALCRACHDAKTRSGR